MEILGVDISNYMEGKRRYKIPEIIGDIFKIYLKQDSARGTVISRIRNDEINRISSEEKRELLKIIITGLKDTNKYDNNELDKFFEFKIQELNYNDEVLKHLSSVKKKINSKIDYEINKLTQINELDGLIVVNDKINEQIDFEDINFQNIEYENDDILREPDVLSGRERIIFSRHLSTMLDETLDNWNKLVMTANYIKNISIDEEAEGILENENINSNSVLSGEKLLQEAIKEHEKTLKRKYIREEQINYDETEEILKEIRKEITK